MTDEMSNMAQLSYDVVPHNGGWAILVTLGEANAFPTKQVAYDIAVELARKLRFAGFSFHVQGDHHPPKKVAGAG
jgi:hypothetical protein